MIRVSDIEKGPVRKGLKNPLDLAVLHPSK